MKMYETPSDTKIVINKDGEKIVVTFYRLEGNYGYCEDKQGNAYFIPSWETVTLL